MMQLPLQIYAVLTFVTKIIQSTHSESPDAAPFLRVGCG